MLVVRAVVFAAFGLAVGSFLTVVIHRVPRRESIVAPRSACPACGAQIGARDNIPVLSYLLLAEKSNLYKNIGIATIVIGVAVLGRGGRKQ